MTLYPKPPSNIIPTMNMSETWPQWVKNGINVTDFGAKGDGVHDDTLAFNLAIQNCLDYNKCLIIPRSNLEYRITEGFIIDKPMVINMEPLTIIKFYPGSPDDVLFKINTYPYDINFGFFEFGRLISGIPGQGIAIEIDSCNTKRVYVHSMIDFQTGCLLSNTVYPCLDNTIIFELIARCTTGITMKCTTEHNMEGNLFDFNFITEGKYGIVLDRSGVGGIALNVFNGVAIHMTQNDGVGIFNIGSGNNVRDNVFNLQYLKSDNGLSVGGNRVMNGEAGFSRSKNNTFNVWLASMDSKVKLFDIEYFNNLNNKYSHHRLEAGYTPVNVSGEAGFNAGVPVNNNYPMFTLDLPAGASGNILQRFVYHQFCGHNTPKMVQFIPVTNTGVFPGDKFDIQVFDNSAAVNREIVITIRYLKEVVAPESVKFYLGIF